MAIVNLFEIKEEELHPVDLKEQRIAELERELSNAKMQLWQLERENKKMREENDKLRNESWRHEMNNERKNFPLRRTAEKEPTPSAPLWSDLKPKNGSRCRGVTAGRERTFSPDIPEEPTSSATASLSREYESTRERNERLRAESMNKAMEYALQKAKQKSV